MSVRVTDWAKEGWMCRIYLVISLGLLQPLFLFTALLLCRQSTRCYSETCPKLVYMLCWCALLQHNCFGVPTPRTGVLHQPQQRGRAVRLTPCLCYRPYLGQS
jgi:hypothetical protein